MAIKDESESVRSEPRKKKRERKPTSIPDRPAPPESAYAPPERKPYRPAATTPAFQKIGFTGSIFDFNSRAEAADLAFEAQFGFKPSPGLLLDLVRAPVRTEEYESLFQIPSSFQRARAQGVLESALQAEQENLEAAEGIADTVGREATPDEEGYDLYGDRISLEEGIGEEHIGGAHNTYWGLPFVAAKQIVESFVYAPAGVYAVGKAGVADVGDVLHGDFTFDNSRRIASAIGSSLAEDFRHPLDNPGYILLDILGAASGGAGFVARTSAARKAGQATRAVRAGAEIPDLAYAENLRPQTLNRIALGQSSRAVLSALSRRPLPGTFRLGPAGAEERILLSENALRRGGQRAFYTLAQRRLMKRLERIPDPVLRRQSLLKGTRQSLFSPETTLGRTARARLRVERDLMLAPLHQLARAERASLNLSRLYRSLPVLSKTTKGTAARSEGASLFGLSVGEHMALQMRAMDDFDPVTTTRNFHEKMIEFGIGDPEAHRAKIAAVELGERVLAKPSKRFKRVLDALDRVSRDQQLLKVEYLGLDPVKAEARIANEAEAMRLAARATDKNDYLRKVDELLGGEPMARIADESFYVPALRRKDAPIHTGGAIGGARAASPFGLVAPNLGRSVPELSHRFEAKAMRAGDTVLDPSLLLGTTYARVVKAVTVVEDYRRLLALSVETPNAALKEQRGHMRAIRLPDAEGVPDELKAHLAVFREDRILTPEEARSFADSKELDALQEYLFPKVDPEAPIPGVRWVDERFLTDLWRYPGEPSGLKKAFLALNEPVKATMIYGRPAYSLNALSNAGMLVIQQGFLAPVSMWKSLRAGKNYGEDVRAAMDALVGDGKAQSFTTQDFAAAKVSRSMADFWSRLVDTWMRRAAFIYEAEKLGYKTADDFKRLLDHRNKDRKIVDKRVEATRRANKSLVEFDNLTWFEKRHLKDIVFVYPWVSRSAVWSVRTMLDHPIKTWGVSELAQMGEKYVEETFEQATGWAYEWLPDWFRDAGYIPVGIDGKGNPLVVNPASVNTFSTLHDLLLTGEGAVTDDPLHSLEDVLGPAAELGLRIVTGRNSFGQKYEHGALGGLAELTGSIPFVSAWRRAEPVERSERDVVSTDPNAPGYVQGKMPHQVAPAIERPSFIPGMEAAYGPLISGGLWPRAVDAEALQARYWRDAPKAAREARSAELRASLLRDIAKHEILMIRHAEDVTSKILGKEVPAPVKRSLKFQEWFQYRFTDYAIKHGRKPTPAEQRRIQIDTLEERGVIGAPRAEELREELGQAIESGDLGTFTASFGDAHLFRRQYQEWHQERNTVLEVANNLVPQLDYLKKAGLFSGPIPEPSKLATPEMIRPSAEQIKRKGAPDFDPQHVIYQVGRKYLDYERRLAGRQPSDVSMLEGVNGAEFRTWLEGQDNPIKIRGLEYPSPVRLKWAADVLRNSIDDPDYEARKIATYSAQGWSTLTSFEKELVLGKPYNPKVSEGWLIYEAVTGGYRGNVTGEDVDHVSLVTDEGDKFNLSEVVPEAFGPGNRDLESDHRLAIAKWIDKNFVKGFLTDYQFAESPKFHRVASLPVIQKSPNPEIWKALLDYAAQEYARIEELRRREETGITAIRDSWRDYVSRVLFPWLQQNDREFLAELSLYGGQDFLRTLIDD